MKHHDLDSLSELRHALEAKRTELVRNHLRLEEVAAEREPHVTNCVAELMERNGFLLSQVLDALDRIESCRYGECRNCGEPVCAKGLAPLPWATLCQPCEQALDSPDADIRPRIFQAV